MEMPREKTNLRKHVWIVLVILIMAGVFIFMGETIKVTDNPVASNQDLRPAEQIDLARDFSKFSAEFTAEKGEIKKTSDGIKYTINPSEIRGGGPPKGGIGIDRGIPALDERNVRYVSVADADKWIQDEELVLALEHNGVKRVYPLQIMVWHEIANDVVGGDPIAVTYCPLCGSGIAYFRVIDSQPVKLGTSGKLFNSNLVMYDDKTDTYWQQIQGNAILGELTGYELKPLSVDTVVWRDYKKSNPGAEVLSQDTGFNRQYGRDPYGNYYEDSFLLFPVENEDNRIHPKTVIFGIEINGKFKAYREEDLKETDTIEDKFAGVNIRIERDKSGIVKVKNLDTGEEIIKERDFWFAWYAFHPDTDLYIK